MQLSATLYPQAAVMASNSVSLSLTTTEMTSTNVDYTFLTTISQGLGTSSSIKINTFPSTVTVPSSPTCDITLLSGTVLSQSCIFDNTTN